MKRVILFSLSAALLLCMSCDNNNKKDDKQVIPPVETTGSLNIDIIDGTTAVENPSNIITRYTVSGAGPDTGTINEDLGPDISANFTGLEPGTWSLTVNGYSDTDELIGQGSSSVNIIAGESTDAAITCYSVKGIGTLSFYINWPSGAAASPSFETMLTDINGIETPLSMTVSDGLAAASDISLVSGYYILTIRFNDDEENLWGMTASMVISADVTITGNYILIQSGESLVTSSGGFDTDMSLTNPVEITFDCADQEEIIETRELTITASSDAVDTRQWYVNGQPLSGETGGSLTLGSSLDAGVYNVSLIVSQGLLLSGKTTELTVSNGMTWVEMPNPIPGIDTAPSSAMVVVDGNFYLTGGSESTYDNSHYRYNRITDTWDSLSNLPEPRSSGASFVINDDIYYVGGAGSGGEKADLYKYVITTDSWTELTPMPEAKYGISATVYDGIAYVFGGIHGAAGSNTAYSYDPSSDTWALLAPIPTDMATRNTSVGIYQGRIIIVGGYRTNATPSNEIHSFSTILGSFMYNFVPSLPENILNAGIAVDGDDLYVIGGSVPGEGPGKKIYKYTYLGSWEVVATLPEGLSMGYDHVHLDTSVSPYELYIVGGVLEDYSSFNEVLHGTFD